MVIARGEAEYDYSHTCAKSDQAVRAVIYIFYYYVVVVVVVIVVVVYSKQEALLT